VGIAILTFVLLILTKDYKPTIHHKLFVLIRRYWLILVLIIIVILVFFGYGVYSKYLADQQFHKSEVAYQNCLDKAASQDNEVQNEVASYKASIPPSGYIPISGFSFWSDMPDAVPTQQNQDRINKIWQKSYFYQWSQAGSPGYNKKTGFWEVYFMNWMMQNHPDFCSEFNVSTIKSFLVQKMSIINKISNE
jgi:hypothetical protein